MKIFERRPNTPILGLESRVEELVKWSSRHKVGDRFQREFPCGLRLDFIANQDVPLVQIRWNHEKFKEFLDLTSPKAVDSEQRGRVHLTLFGIAVDHNRGHSKVRLLGAGRNGDIVLWDSDSQPGTASPSYTHLCGTIALNNEGPEFLKPSEKLPFRQQQDEPLVVGDKEPAAPAQEQTVDVAAIVAQVVERVKKLQSAAANGGAQ